ncbi:MAG: ATP-binding cassette domain-containing protein [Rhodospirillales bacterium]|nr:ATP-binding cassette domain-containing protein [Rhodospirillales bacterium]MDH3911413.1 ATP-binding cassette domain-containing protein [Rhodospirillales bacterium]MDH3920835.1 ATP-binding cassette domain-containing protein [Rhodospirillales bacterium]MDH3968663.1 ATP-binding cassette domain-containing protein [Rhodospirillales bacterium]
MSASILPGRLEGLGFEAGGRRLIDGLTLAFEAGPRTVILGPNGAGKSLTLRLAHGLIAPSAGRVVWRTTGAGRRQALVFQRPVMLRRSAAANVDYALALRRVTGAERVRRRDRVLERTGLAELARRPARVLSTGEQQRLALARAWAIEPEVLFLDEPTASLDPAATRAVEAIVNAIHEAGTKIVMTTHDLGQARRLADEIVFLHRGRLLEHAPAETFFDAPASAEARAFLEGDLLW